jgi:hypothetical protein
VIFELLLWPSEKVAFAYAFSEGKARQRPPTEDHSHRGPMAGGSSDLREGSIYVARGAATERDRALATALDE